MNKSLILLNNYKTEIMNAYRYIKRVHEAGIESKEQFDTFINLCENHVANCNIICKKLKPVFGFIQRTKYKIYKDFRSTCEFTVSDINNMISTTQAVYDKLAEIEELRETMTIKAQIDYELATEYKEVEIQRQADIREKRKIGFEIEQSE